MPETTTLELRLLDKQAGAYPVELTLIETKQIFHGRLSADILPWNSSGDSKIDGQSLFNALFAAPEMLKGWGVASGRAAPRRLQVRIDPPELHALPWELLREGADLLAADADTPFSRYLAVSKEWGQPITARPLRVLAAISNPLDLPTKYPDLPAADVDLEAQTLRTAIGVSAELIFLPAPITLDRLEAELRKGYHVLHFIGHGAFNEKKQQAALYLQDADGNAQRVIDEDFAGMLNRLSAPPHVVVLAACQSAKQADSGAFTGLGPQLVQIGVPAVIAMQENVTVLTARQFAATFYQRLLEHGVVDLAMNEARGTLITQGRYDAAVPVLFMRLPDGRLWKAEDIPEQRLPAPPMHYTDKVFNVSGGTIITGGTFSGDIVAGDKKTNIGTSPTSVQRAPDSRMTDTGRGGADTGGGGITIKSKNVKISGDSIIGDKIITTDGSKYVGRDDKSVVGWSAKDIENFFKSITQQIDAKRDLDPQDKQDLKSDVKDVQDEVAKGEKADESFLDRRLRSIKRMAPDILETIAATLANPQLGLATVIRKVMQKAQA